MAAGVCHLHQLWLLWNTLTLCCYKCSHCYLLFRICAAVSEYFEKQFLSKWNEINENFRQGKRQPESTTISAIAALVKERNDDFKTVVLGIGTKYNERCSCVPGDPLHLCDGHAEGVCFYLTSGYFISEMYNCVREEGSIFTCTATKTFKLKSGISFHFFVSHAPCGFMTGSEKSNLISWKPHLGIPHIPECSTKILMNTFLGIQGRVSHILDDPIYVESIVLLSHANVYQHHIEQCLTTFQSNLKSTSKKYHFVRPVIDIACIKQEDLFKQFKRKKDNLDTQEPEEETEKQPSDTPQCKIQSELPSQEQPSSKVPLECSGTNKKPPRKQAKNLSNERASKPERGTKRVAGSMPDVIGNSGIKVFVWTTDEGIMSTDYLNTIKDLEKRIKEIKSDFKEEQRKELMKASEEQRKELMKASEILYEALKVKEVLEELEREMPQSIAESHKKKCNIVKDAQFDQIRTWIDSNLDQLQRKKPLKDLESEMAQLTVLKGHIDKAGQNLPELMNALQKNIEYKEKYEQIKSQDKIMLGCEWDSYIKSL